MQEESVDVTVETLVLMEYKQEEREEGGKERDRESLPWQKPWGGRERTTEKGE